jgi:phosphomevalonate kinase
MSARTIVSSPGKVLVAGGYVVLERPNPGLVVAVSQRVYAVVQDRENTDNKNSIEVKIDHRK